MSLLVKGISVFYGKRQIIKELSFDIAKGEMVALLGVNGAGKSTLLKSILFLLKAKTGEVFIDNQSLNSLNIKERAKYFAYVPQYIDTIFSISVLDFIILGLKDKKRGANVDANDLDKVDKIIKNFQLEHLVNENLINISGGERQRVMLAKAISQEAKVLLLDEPTSSLDIYYQKKTFEILAKIIKKNQTSILSSIHDVNLAAMYFDKFLLLKDGDIFAYGNKEEVLTKEILEKIYNIDIDIITHKDKKVIIFN